MSSSFNSRLSSYDGTKKRIKPKHHYMESHVNGKLKKLKQPNLSAIEAEEALRDFEAFQSQQQEANLQYRISNRPTQITTTSQNQPIPSIASNHNDDDHHDYISHLSDTQDISSSSDSDTPIEQSSDSDTPIEHIGSPKYAPWRWKRRRRRSQLGRQSYADSQKRLFQEWNRVRLSLVQTAVVSQAPTHIIADGGRCELCGDEEDVYQC